MGIVPPGTSKLFNKQSLLRSFWVRMIPSKIVSPSGIMLLSCLFKFESIPMRKLLLAASIFCLCFPLTDGANAQAIGLAGKCAQILLQYFGKPLAAELAKEASGEIASYFREKYRQGSNAVTQEDVKQLQNRGVTPCQLRAALDTVSGRQPLPYPQTFSAQAYCSATGVTGTSHMLPSPEQALQSAIHDCIYRGGIPQCCQHGAMLVPE